MTWFRDNRRAWASWVVVVLAAVVLFLADRHRMNPDGVSYIDMARLAADGHPGELVNAYWSPLLPALLSAAYFILGAGPEWTYPVAHLVQALLFVIGYGLFWSLAQQLARTAGADGLLRSRWLVTAAYIWLHSRIGLIALVTPDLLGYVCLWGIALFGLRWVGSCAPRDGVGFGLFCGLGALTKGFYVPFGALCLGLSVVFLPPRSMLKSAIPAAVFLLVGALWFVPVRFRYPSFPWGAAGPLATAWATQDVGTSFIHWHPSDDRHGTPVHTTRKIHADPAVYEFAGPIRGTYAPWYDPAYWFEGIRVGPTRKDRWGRVKTVLRSAARTPLYWEVGILWGLVVLGAFFSAGHLPSFLKRNPMSRSYLWLGAITCGGFLAIASLGYFPRYWGGFLLLFTLLGGWWVAAPSGPSSRRLQTAIVAVACILAIRFFPVGPAIDSLREPSVPQNVVAASGLRAITGARYGEKDIPIGYVGDSFKGFFVQLADHRIVAEIPRKNGAETDFCGRATQIQGRALATMLEAGARVVVIGPGVPCGRGVRAWISASKSILSGKVLLYEDLLPRGGAS